MLSFIFKLGDESEEVHEFDMGHMTIACGKEVVTSEFKTPNQAMMIFLSIQMLMAAVRKIVVDKNCKISTFNAIDSSFAIIFKKSKNDDIGLEYKNKLICKVKTDELINSIWTASTKFYEKYENNITGTGAVIEDWNMTRSEFEELVSNQ